MKKIIYIFVIAILVAGCEKEISVTLPDTTQQYVVEASVNQLFPNLNYIFISKSVDYFNPDLSMRGISGAIVKITDDTLGGITTTFTDISTIPGLDTLLKGFTGIYFSATFAGKENHSYNLDISLPDGAKISGRTMIPKAVPIDSIAYSVKNEDNNHDQKNDVHIILYFTDPPGQNNYRLARHHDTTNLMLGWGTANSTQTFDDQLIDNAPRIINSNQIFGQGDTMNFYLNSIGRNEFLFWQSFQRVANNGGPFATPVAVKSNITGAIGSFTGYGCSFKQIILK